ncbi:MAG TPA: hypothetical protein VFO85_16180, partial [Vicinamibacteria bacterium]|nr:hypothetical protein [Vicinamibacteria bacterium]
MADAQELIQTVTDMEERARTVPETVKRVADLAAEYQSEVDACLERVGQKKERVSALKAKVDEVLRALQEKAETERQVLEGGVKQVETAVDQAREAVSGALGELEDALEAATDAVSTLKSALAEAGERAEAAQSAAAGDVDGLRGQMASSEPELDLAVGTAMNTTDGVEEEAERAREKVVAGLDALGQRMDEYAEEHVPTRLERAAAAVEDVLEGHGDHLEGVMTALDGGAKEIAKSVESDIEEQVTEAVGQQVERAASSYLELQQAHQRAAEASG